MSKEIKRKGISLVALVITIIVLVVLTGAVVITGINVPQQGQLAVFKNNTSSIQDAVTMKMLNNLVNYREKNNENVKWIGVASGYAEDDIEAVPVFDTQINGVDVVALDASLKNEIQIKEDEFAKYYVDANGIIYHMGFVYDGITYYNGSTSVTAVESISITGQISKIKYTVGERIDKTGLEVTAVLKDGTTEEVTSRCIFTPDLLTVTGTAGEKEISVSYGGRTANAKIQIVVALPEWISTSTSLNTTTPYASEMIKGITYYAPIPKGFVASTVEGENKISEGLVIYEGNQEVNDENVKTMKNTANQFVWVPVNNTYTMLGDITGDGIFHNRETTNYNYDIPYLDNNTTTALAYWQASENGHSGTIVKDASTTWTYSEPYSSAGSWETTEYQAMVTSVIKYGGFYVGRYETGYETIDDVKKPIVQAGKSVWNNIKWNSVNTMNADPTSGTATFEARNMYGSDRTDVGVRSTLIYGIQWDSTMCWAKCYNNTRKIDTYTATPSLTGAAYVDGRYDVNNNIYDLAGNVTEWSMEARDTSYRIYRGYFYSNQYEYAVSGRFHTGQPSGSAITIGFRTALYVK